LIVIPTGPEPLTGSTRLVAGTATKVFLNTLTTSVFTKLGKIRGNRMIDLRATNEKLHDRCLRILCELFPELDRAQADRALSAAGGRLREAVETYEEAQ
jgi:N-acetylmuramic acid 6-phosphate etherase